MPRLQRRRWGMIATGAALTPRAGHRKTHPMSRRLVIVAALALAAAPAGCHRGKHDGASCDEVGARFTDLARRQLDQAKQAGAVDDKTRTAVEGHVPAMRDSIVRGCKEGGWSAETRGCFARAESDTQMTTCYAAMPADQRAKLEKE